MTQISVQGSRGSQYPFDKGKHLIVVSELLAYADESGTQEKPRYCSIAGWIGSPRQWRKFDEEWNRVLNKYDVPGFHATDFFSRSNPYRRWKIPEMHGFIRELVNALSRRRLYPIGGAVDVDAFMSYSKGERRYLTSANIKQSGKWVTTGAPSKPYHLAFPIFLLEATQAATDDTVVHFIFDRNHIEAPYALQVFREMKDRKSHKSWEKLGRITYSGSMEEPGLQAADLYVHLWCRFLERGAESMGPERYWAWQRLKKRRDWMKVADRQFFEPMLATLTPKQRNRLKGDLPCH